MAKYVRLENNIVAEIIPPEATKPSIEYWYDPEFAAQCIEAPDAVQQHWVYNPEAKTFSPPPPTPEPEPTPEDETTEALKILLGVE